MTELEQLGVELIALAVRVLGGYDKAKAVLEAQYAATDAAMEKLENEKLSSE